MKNFSTIVKEKGIPWVRHWIDATFEFSRNFLIPGTNDIDYEALGREEWEFRKALKTKDFSKNDRARYVWEEALKIHEAKKNNGKKGGRPKKINGDAPTREDGENDDNGGITTASANMESGTSPTNMPRVGQNEARPRIQGGERPAQGPMSLSPEEAAQSGNLYDCSGKPYDKTNDQVTVHPRGYTGASRGASTAKNSTKSSQKSKIPGNFDTVIDWCVEHGQDIDDARQIWDMTRERGGHDADGNKIENWWGYLVQCLKTKKENRK